MAGPDLSVLGASALPPGSNPAAGNPLAALINVLNQLVQGQGNIVQALQGIGVQVPQIVNPPTTTTDPGMPGQFSYDATYVYFYTQAGWGRILLDYAF